MPRLTQACPHCGKNLELISTAQLTDIPIRLKIYKCGYISAEDSTKPDLDNLVFNSVYGDKHARPYQCEGIKFIIASDFNVINGDQMRLGKTPQALLALRNRYKERTPCLIVVRAANLWQWVNEFKTWTDPTPLGIFPILGTKTFIPPGFHTYIISMDTFSRAGTCKNCKHSLSFHDEKKHDQCSRKGCACREPKSNGDSIVDRLRAIDFKLIIVDEAHSFKNTSSNRSQALVNFLQEKNTVDAKRILYYRCPMCRGEWEKEQTYQIINGIEKVDISGREHCPSCNTIVGFASRKEVSTERKCGIVLLTGTAIKNRAEEYFVPLNLVAPTKFPSLERFRRQWLMQDDRGQWSRINPYAYERFKLEIAPYVIRREKEDVYTDLPKLNRMFTVIEPDLETYAKQYNKVLDKMDEKLARHANPSYFEFATDMMELRRITGLMKTMWTADYAEACLFDSDSTRLSIGIHHYDVSDILRYKLSHLGVLKLDGRDTPERKYWLQNNFQATSERIILMNMLAGGVGMDFPYVPKVIILERAWSFADEEQFEFRFYNPDKDLLAQRGIDPDKVTDVEYIVAKGTFEEYWFNMVEYKKTIQGETIGTQWDLKTQPKLFKTLLEETVSHRL